MTQHRHRWTIIIALLLSLVVLGSVASRKSIHSETMIDASPELIWEILMDEESYPIWNKVLIPIKGEIEEGNRLTYKLIQASGDSIEVNLKVKACIAQELLNQKGGIPGVFTFNHRYVLEQKDGRTQLIIHEDFRGIGVLFTDLNWLESAYSKLGQDLGKRALQLEEDQN